MHSRFSFCHFLFQLCLFKRRNHSLVTLYFANGVYYTKFEYILKATLMPTNRTRGARGGSKLPRTLVSFRHCLAEPRQPRKKNTPCISDLAGAKFLLKKERVFFFRVLPSKYSGRWRNNADEVLVKLFFRERICQNFGSFVFEFGCRKWKRRGLGRNFPFAPLFVLGEFGRAKAKIEKKCYSC